MFLLWNFALAPLTPLLAIYTLHRRFIKGKSAASFAGQWGQISPQMREFGQCNGPRIWIHAVSVAQTMAAKPIIAALKSQNPNCKIALSSTTDTGHEIAQNLQKSGAVDLAFYFPLDLPPVLNRVLDALRPDKIGFVETELWPNLLHLARQRQIATFLLNGRISDNMAKKARKLGPIWRWMRGNVSLFLMRGTRDAKRAWSLGVRQDKIIECGDVKLEAPPISGRELRQKWRQKLGISDDETVLICGSTHAGEETLWLDFARQNPDLRLAIAPRHPERFAEVAAQIGDKICRRSTEKTWKNGEIFLLDSVGELGEFYALGDVAFVGGSLIERGGHNVLEPILVGVPTLFGPHIANFRAAVELVKRENLGQEIEKITRETLEKWLLLDKDEFAACVEKSLAPHRGAAAKMAAYLLAE